MNHFVERDGDARSRGIAVGLNVSVKFFIRRVQFPDDVGDDPFVGLVADDVIDLIQRQAGLPEKKVHAVRNGLYREAEHLPSVHVQRLVGLGDAGAEQIFAVPFGAEGAVIAVVGESSSTAAPAPSPNKTQVFRSLKSVTRERTSLQISRA